MTERLVIDLARCDQCRAPECSVDCSRPDSSDGGRAMLALREKATFEVICRRCAHASCVLACPFDALERNADGVITRHNLRCVSCKSCAVACPFGTIYDELLPFYSLSYESGCRACVAAAAGEAPPCVGSCPEGALEYRDVDDEDEAVHVVDECLAVQVSARARLWNRQETAP